MNRHLVIIAGLALSLTSVAAVHKLHRLTPATTSQLAANPTGQTDIPIPVCPPDVPDCPVK